ncbi:MAG TPA: GxxExxY protein [Chitinophagaceae bacterium]|nr:GxxExxY protein [Chitinophagaceae bacterium]
MTQNITGKNHKPLTEREKWLASQVVDSAITIHKFLGPGLPESVYEKCFCYELTKRNIPFIKQKCTELIYDNVIIDEGLQIDIMVDDLIVIELKAQEVYHLVWEAQLLSYLRLANKRLGYILNFHVPLMKDGLKRMIL